MQTLSILDWLELAAKTMSALFVIFLPLELYRRWRTGKLTRASIIEMLASATPLIPTVIVAPLVIGFITALYGFADFISPWRIPTTWSTVILVLLLVDFMYYWDHRMGHRIRAYWAISHSVHHSSWQYDQTTGFRISFIDGFISPWFYLPIVLIGFDPLLVLACFGVILTYQQWLHTETICRLGWLDLIFNTPSNHRVHHAVQPEYIDRNYGAIFMIWDHCFGTYAAECEAPIYGLTQPVGSSHPWYVHIVEIQRLYNDIRATARWRDRWQMIWRPPGWKPVSSALVPPASE